MEDFALQLQSLVSQLAALGVVIGDEEIVTKYLQVVAAKYSQIALSIQTLIDALSRGHDSHLKAVDDCTEMTATASSKLLLTEEWAARMSKHQSGEGSSAAVAEQGSAAASPCRRRTEAMHRVPSTRILVTGTARRAIRPRRGRSRRTSRRRKTTSRRRS